MINHSEISAWQRHLDSLTSEESKIDINLFSQLSQVLEHLPTETAPRLMKTYEKCVTQTHEVFGQLFDRVDTDDDNSLNSLLNLMLSFGNFRIAQITYSIERPLTTSNASRALDDSIHEEDHYTPSISKQKWYDLEPLLPRAGERGWKYLLSRGLSNQSHELFSTSIRMLIQKVQFYATILNIKRFDASAHLIRRNAEKTIEILCDKLFKCDRNENVLGMQFINPFLFNLVMPFATTEQQVIILEFIVDARFEFTESGLSSDIASLNTLVDECVMTNECLQEKFLNRMLYHLKSNIIRRKRRHSTEPEEEKVTLESIMDNIIAGAKYSQLLKAIQNLAVSAKRLQTTYLQSWIQFFTEILGRSKLTHKSWTTVFSVCYVLLITASAIEEFYELRCYLATLIKQTVESRDKHEMVEFYASCDKEFLCSLLQSLSGRVELLDNYICFLRISVHRKDQSMLDLCGEQLMKLYKSMCLRVEVLTASAYDGSAYSEDPLDTYLPLLANFYAENRKVIGPYLSCDLYQTVCNYLLSAKSPLNGTDINILNTKKAAYNEIKAKLQSLDAKATESDQIYQTIINRQYNSVVNPAIASRKDASDGEEICCKKHANCFRILGELFSIILNNCELDLYRQVADQVVGKLETLDAFDHPKVLYTQFLLRALFPKQSKESPKSTALKSHLKQISCFLIRTSKSIELGQSLHTFTNAGDHKSNGAILCCTYASCINTYSFIFTRYPSKETNLFITGAMQLIISSNLARYAKYSIRLHRFFIQLATSISNLLKAVCMGRKGDQVIKSSIPVYFSVFSLLTRCVIIASDRQKLEETRKQGLQNGNSHDTDKEAESSDCDLGNHEDAQIMYESNLEHLARDIGRIANNLSALEVKLVDYAPHLIGTYIRDTQRASCPGFVRKHLDEGIFRIFNLIDAHQKVRQEQVMDAGIQRRISVGKTQNTLFEMIHARLDQANREIFKSLHDNYSQFHRYTGKC